MTDAEAPRTSEDWRLLYREHGEGVFRLMHRWTGDAHLAEDLTHDAFVRVWERAGQFRGRGSLKSWLFQIAANLARERMRQGRRRSELLAREGPHASSFGSAGQGNVETRIALEAALSRLPDDQRAALLLYEVDGYSHAEIGEMLGIAEGSSRARISRAKNRLRELLEGSEP